MKKYFLITLLLIPFIGFSQTTKPIDGFLGIKFGSTKLAVITAINAKGGKVNKSNSKAEMLEFDNVKLGHREAAVFIVKFFNNKAYEADFCFRPEVEAKIIEEYNDLINDVSGVYGNGIATNNYSSPYKEGDGDTLIGLSSGNVDLHTVWQSTNSNTIYINIMTQMIVKLTYQDGVLTSQAIAHQKAKESADY